jgi:hypothetical protein
MPILERTQEEKIFEVKQLIWKLKEERTEAREQKDFHTTSYLSAQIYGLEQAINIFNK